MYYGNQECEVLANIGINEAVIELCIGEIIEEYGDEAPYSEPYKIKIVVNKKYITKFPFDKQAKVQECKKMIDDTNKEVAKVKKEANSEIKAEKTSLQNEIKSLRDRSSSFKGFSEYLNFLENKYSYVVYLENYRSGIRKLDEIMCNCDSNELAAVSFRSYRKAKWAKDFEGWLYINEYSDDSGHSKYKVKGFRSLKEAEEFFGKAISDGLIKITDHVLTECNEHKITNDVIEAYRIEKADREETSKQERIKKLKDELVKVERIELR